MLNEEAEEDVKQTEVDEALLTEDTGNERDKNWDSELYRQVTQVIKFNNQRID